MGAKILIVDDEPDVVAVVQGRLVSAGYEVTVMADGQQALECVKKHPPDLMVLDVMLPTLNGYEVCTMIKQDIRYRAIPVVMLTARTEEKDVRLGRECGADAYLLKPFQANELMQTIQALLRSGSGERPTP